MNNNFSKLGKQLLAIWSQLGASQRISVLAATFVLLAGVVTVDVLNRLIRDNPHNMTAAIRDWMQRGTKPE